MTATRISRTAFAVALGMALGILSCSAPAAPPAGRMAARAAPAAATPEPAPATAEPQAATPEPAAAAPEPPAAPAAPANAAGSDVSVRFSGLPAGTYPAHLHSACNGGQAFHVWRLANLFVDASSAGSVSVPAGDTGRGLCVVVYTNASLSRVLAFRMV